MSLETPDKIRTLQRKLYLITHHPQPRVPCQAPVNPRFEHVVHALGRWLPVETQAGIEATDKANSLRKAPTEAYSVDSGNATCSVSHSGDHGIAETNSRWREGTRFPSFKMRFPTRRIVWRSCSSAVGPAVSSAPPAARLAVLH